MLKFPEELSPLKFPPCFSTAALALLYTSCAVPENGMLKLHVDISLDLRQNYRKSSSVNRQPLTDNRRFYHLKARGSQLFSHIPHRSSHICLLPSPFFLKKS